MSCLIGTIAKSLLSESEDWSFTNAIEYAHTLPHHATSVTKVDCFTVAASRRVVGSPGSAVVHDEAYGAVCGVDGLLAQRESSELVQEIDHALFSGYFQALAQKGSFSGFYFNQITERLSLFTDPLGQIPLYYSYNSHQVFFSTLPAAILEAAPPHTLHVNDRALSALLVYEHLMGEDTLFQEIKRVPPGSVIHFEIGSLSSPQKIHYWSIENIQEQSYHSLSEAAEEVFPSFKRAITDSASFCTRPCVFLTGGLDSRTIAGTLFDQMIPFQSFTYGIDSCRDIELAKLVALEVKSPLTVFHLEPASWIFENADQFIRHTMGSVNLIHSHGISVYPQVSSESELHLSGVAGGSFTGLDTIPERFLRLASFSQFQEEASIHYSRGLGLAFGMNDALKQYFPERFELIQQFAVESLSQSLLPHKNCPPTLMSDNVTLLLRYFPLFTLTRCVERQWLEVACPYLDFDTFCKTASVAPKLRYGRSLQKEIFDLYLPKLSLIPTQAELQLPSNRLFRQPSPELQQRVIEPGRDYPKWFRAYGTDWIDKVLEQNVHPCLHAAASQLRSEMDKTYKKSYQERRRATGQFSMVLTILRLLQLYRHKTS